jgi:hypothetical protein
MDAFSRFGAAAIDRTWVGVVTVAVGPGGADPTLTAVTDGAGEVIIARRAERAVIGEHAISNVWWTFTNPAGIIRLAGLYAQDFAHPSGTSRFGHTTVSGGADVPIFGQSLVMTLKGVG